MLIESPFGYRNTGIAGAATFHQGVDLAAPAGYHVTLNHRDGYSSVYLHMNHFVASPGQWVNQGEIIGYVGSTGISTDNQLHFGISKDGVCVDPAAYLPLF